MARSVFRTQTVTLVKIESHLKQKTIRTHLSKHHFLRPKSVFFYSICARNLSARPGLGLCPMTLMLGRHFLFPVQAPPKSYFILEIRDETCPDFTFIQRLGPSQAITLFGAGLTLLCRLDPGMSFYGPIQDWTSFFL